MVTVLVVLSAETVTSAELSETASTISTLSFSSFSTLCPFVSHSVIGSSVSFVPYVTTNGFLEEYLLGFVSLSNRIFPVYLFNAYLPRISAGSYISSPAKFPVITSSFCHFFSLTVCVASPFLFVTQLNVVVPLFSG